MMGKDNWKIMNWEASEWIWIGQTIVNEECSFIIDKISFGVQCVLSVSIPTTELWGDKPLTEPKGNPRAFLGLQNGSQTRYKAVFG